MHLLTIIANLCGLQKLRDDYADAFGDVPALHEGLRLSGRKPGGGQSLTREPVTVDVRTHRGMGSYL